MGMAKQSHLQGRLFLQQISAFSHDLLLGSAVPQAPFATWIASISSDGVLALRSTEMEMMCFSSRSLDAKPAPFW